jgi:hypothetical protein
LKGVAVVCLALALGATVAVSAGKRRYHDHRQASYSVALDANDHRVLSARFLVFDPSYLRCDNANGGGLVGGWQVKDAEIENGHFRAVRSESVADNMSYRVVFQGTIDGDTARGSVALRIFYSGTRAGATYQCWSGGSKGKPAVPFVAKAK